MTFSASALSTRITNFRHIVRANVDESTSRDEALNVVAAFVDATVVVAGDQGFVLTVHNDADGNQLVEPIKIKVQERYQADLPILADAIAYAAANPEAGQSEIVKIFAPKLTHSHSPDSRDKRFARWLDKALG